MGDLSRPLLRGWQGLEDLEGFAGGEFRFVPGSESYAPRGGCWILPCTLTHTGVENPLVPRQTNWVLVVSPRYPLGEVRVRPAAAGGIDVTFEHQIYNGVGEKGCPWREGRICLSDGVRTLDRGGAPSEEDSSAEGRLRWHATRALYWVHDAAAGALTKKSDPFELPYLPCGSSGARLGFREDESSLEVWTKEECEFGFATLAEAGKMRVVTRFETAAHSLIHAPEWGDAVGGNELLAGWIRFPSAPVLEPWQAPRTWGELREVAEAQGVSLDDALRRLSKRLRDRARHHMFIGFPIPDEVGGPDVAMHWFALLLPRLTRKGSGGVSKKPGALYRRDAQTVLSDSESIQWLPTANVAPGELRRRGHFGKELSSSRTVLLGSGAVGSVAGEIVVRGGVSKVSVVDGQLLEVGNLVRHMLDLDSVGESKASALAKKLSRIAPDVVAKVVFGEFYTGAGGEVEEALEDASLVLDCTASDDVLRELGERSWPAETTIVSMAVGYGASRLYLYAASGADFDAEQFFDELSRWSSLDETQAEQGSEIREGRGCFDSVFPGRFDQISGLVASGLGWLDLWIATGREDPELLVLESGVDESGYPFIRRALEPSS